MTILGFVADPARDGWTVGSPAYFGDYFLPQAPYQAWGVTVNSSNYFVDRNSTGGTTFPGGVTGGNLSNTLVGSVRHAIWQGDIGNLRIKKDIYFDSNALYFVANITLRNMGASDLLNVHYLQMVNPDNDGGNTSGSTITTKDTIKFQNPNIDNKTLVIARGSSTNSYLGLGSKDCRAKVFRFTSTWPSAVSAKSIYDGSSFGYAYSGGASSNNQCIGIVFDVDTLKVGDSTTVAYTYILKQEDIDSAFTEIKPNWKYNGVTYNSGDTIRVCSGSVLPITIENGGSYNWNSWTPTTGLATTAGTSNTITVDDTVRTYRAIGINSSSVCSTVRDTLYLTIAPHLLPDTPVVSSSISYCHNAVTSAISASGTSLKWYNAPTGGTFVTSVTPSSATLGITNYYVTQTNTTTGCESKRKLVRVAINPKPDSVSIISSGLLTFCAGDSVILTANSRVFNGFGSTSYLQGASASGSPYVCDCPNGSIVVGYQGNSGGLLDRFALICKPIDRFGVLGSTTTITSFNGAASGPNAYGPFTFPGTRMLVGLNARNESWSGGYFGEVSAYGQNQSYITALGDNSLTPSVLSPVSSINPTTSMGNIFTPSGTVASGMFAYPTLYSSGVSLRYTPIGAYKYTYSWSSAPASDTNNNVIVKSSGSYTLTVTNSLGCSATSPAVNVIVNPAPTISGTLNACVGKTSSLSGTATAHPTTPWSSSNNAIATVSSTGVVTGISAGSVTITYMINTGCTATATFTVSALPSAPSTATSVTYCQDASATSLSATGTSIKWYTAASGGTGATTAPTPVTTTPGITTYYVTQTNSFGCESTPRTAINVTVNPKPVSVTATPLTATTFCIGDSVILNGSASVFTNFGNTPFFNAPSASGTIYTCDCPNGFAAVGYEGRTGAWMDRFNLICKGISRLGVIGTTTATTLSNGSSAGGGYSGPYLFTGTNLLVGVTVKSEGSSFLNDITGYGQSLSYILGLGDNTASPVTLSSLSGGSPVTNLGTGWAPNGSVITGMFSYPTGYSTGVSFRYTPIGAFKYTYLWSSSATDTNSSLTVKSSGTYSMTVINSLGCSATSAPVNVTVNPLPTITGVLNTCVGSTSLLTGSASPHGTTPWTSSNTAVATVSSTGLVTGVSAGTVTITYRNTNNCTQSVTFTVNSLPTITGTLVTCVGQTSTLSGSATAHPTTPWTSSNTSVATVSSTGVVTGVSGGTSIITYRNANGCTQTATFTVNPLPTISGTLNACVGQSSALSGSASPHATTPWTSSNTAVATVSSTGLVTGVSAGTAMITYRNSNNCTQSITFTVNSLPTITGTLIACVGQTSTLTGSATAHSTTPWTSSNTSVATVSNSGVVTGVAGGTTIITYRNSNGCTQTATFTVNPLPTISGTLSVCVGQSSTLTGSASPDATAPWTSSDTSVAKVTASGLVTAISAGSSIITYKNSNGCIRTVNFTVNPLPLPPVVSTPVNLCIGVPATALTAVGTSLKWYTVSSGGTGSTAAPIPSTVAIDTTDYYVSQTNTFGCEGPRATITVIVNPTPLVSISSLSPYGFIFCKNLSVTIKANSATAASWQWDTSGVALTGRIFDTVAANKAGKWGVTVASAFGCKNRAEVTVYMDSTKPPILSPTAITICEEGSALMTCSPGFVSYTFEWMKDNVFLTPSTLKENLKNAILPGSYSVRVTNNYGCIDTTNIALVSTYPKPLKPVITNLDPILEVAAGYRYYQWYFNNKIIVGANSRSIVTKLSGDYFVEVTDENGCLNNSDTVAILKTNTINNVVSKSMLKIYPNPSKDVVYIESPVNIMVRVTDVIGRVIFEGKNPQSVSLSNLANGHYFFRISDENDHMITVEKITKIE